MIDHVTFGIADFAVSVAFCDRAFAPPGVKRRFDVPFEPSAGVRVTGDGDARPWSWIAEQDATRGTLEFAVAAPRRVAVDEFYGAIVFDPDGHHIEAVVHGPA
jgi:catechol 2,3-dioxygenase-like lactoylglutathione lyase family enzyme